MTWRWKILALLAAVLLFAAACGDSDDAAEQPPETTETPETTEAPPEETEEEGEGEAEAEEEIVRADADLVIWADDTRTPVIRPLAEAFGEENGLTVAVQEVAFDQIRERFQAAAPAGQGPDIIIGAHDWLGQLVTSGVVAPIDLGGAAGDFSDVALEAMSYEGQLYGLPYAIENIALIRNTELVPESPATFEELEEVALALVADGSADVPLAIQQSPGDPYHNYPLFSALGGYVFGQNADGSLNPDDLGIDSEGGLTAAAKFGEWTESGLISGDVSYDVMIESFGQGRAPFAITGPWAIAQGDTGFDATGVPYVVEPIPPVEGGTPRPFVGVQGFMVSAQAENPLAAQTFLIEVMADQEAQTALFEAGGRPPAHLGAFEDASSDPNIEGFGQAGIEGEPLPAIPAMGSVWTAWTDAYQLIFTGQAEPEEAFRQAAEQIRALIADS
jgi:arabinogalactan oligomer / maltooligosaccharide transport system substrate-binding protein